MARVAGIVLSFFLTLGGAIGLAHHFLAEPAAAEAKDLYRYRAFLIDTPWERPVLAGRFITWLGDSTLFGLKSPTFMHKLSKRLAPAHVRGSGRAYIGLDFFHYYCLLPAVLEADPDLVVVVANLRNFPRGRRNGRAVDLCSSLGFERLLRGRMLPWHDRGITFARLLLAQTLRWKPLEYWFYFLEGTRRLATAWVQARIDDLIPSPEVLVTAESVGRGLTKLLRDYDEPLSPSHPVVRMMGATVREARRRNVPIIVVALPLPYHFLQQYGQWSTETFAMRTAVLRKVVQDNGGIFVDLHLALLADEFRDRGGHFNQPGAEHLARLLEPTVRRTLGLKPTKRSTPPQSR